MNPNRKPLIAANWKMYKTPDPTREFFRDFPEKFDLRDPGKIYMAEYAKFIAQKNEKLGSARKLEEVRKLIK